MFAGFPRLHPILPGQFEGRLDRIGTAGQEIEFVEIADREGLEFRSQILDRVVGKRHPVDVGNFSNLFSHLVDDFGHPVTQIGHIGATRPVEIVLAGLVKQPRALAPNHFQEGTVELPVDHGGVGVAVCHRKAIA